MNKMYESMKIKDIRVQMRPGRFARVKWTDSGATDCLVVEKVSDGRITKNTEFRGFFLDSETVSRFSTDQIIAIGDYLEVDTGI